MKEIDFSNKVRDAIKGFGGRMRTIRDAVQAGTPDAMYAYQGHQGLIEFKYTDHWPRDVARIPMGHGLTPAQWAYLWDWREKGCAAWVMLGVDHDWYLIDPKLILEEECKYISLGRLQKVSTAFAKFDSLVRLREILILY